MTPSPALPELRLGDRAWRGIDQFHAPEDVAPGFAQTLDNLVIEGKQLAVRPGRQGLLAAPLGAAVYALTAVRTGTQTDLWFVSGGQLYRMAQADTTATAVAGMAGLASASVRMAQVGGYVYVVDGTGSLKRVKADGTGGGVVTGLSQPGTAQGVVAPQLPFSAAPANLALVPHLGDLVGTTDYWTASSQSLISASEGGFPTGSSFWAYFGGPLTSQTMEQSGVGCAIFDGLNKTATSDPIVTPSDSNVAGNDGPQYPKLFVVTFRSRLRNWPLSSKICWAEVTVRAFSDTAGTVQVAETVVRSEGANKDEITDHLLVDFRDVGDAIRSIQVVVEGKGQLDATYSGSNVDMEVGAFDVLFPRQRIELTRQAGGDHRVRLRQFIVDGQKVLARGVEWVLIFAGAQDFSTTPALQLSYNCTEPVALRPYLEDATSRSYLPDIYLEPVSASERNAPTAARRARLDLSEVSPTVRDSALMLGFQILEDPDLGAVRRFNGPSTVTQDCNVPLLSLRGLEKVGSLTPGVGVWYRYVEVDASADAANLRDVIVSDGSDPTGVVEPTGEQGATTVFLPGRTNGSATHWALYRFGDLGETVGRLLTLQAFGTADVAYGADAAKGSAPYFAAPANPFLSWDAPGVTGGAGGSVVDNTPTSWLLGKALYSVGREAPPPAPRDVCEWMGRLWLISGENELYGSWLLDQDRNAGLYFTRARLLDDPERRIKGFYSQVGTRENDRAVRVLAVEDRLAVLRAVAGPYQMLGTEPDLFELRPYRDREDAGCVAPGSAVVVGGAVVYLSPSGLVAWSPEGGARPFSELLRRVLNPSLMGGVAIGAAAYALCAGWWHGDCFYLAAPAPGGSSNSVIYRYDGTAEGWTRWLQGNVSGGCVAAGSTDTNTLYVGGLDGQVYKFVAGAGDKATSGAGATAISWSLVTRAYTVEGGEFAILRPHRLRQEVETGAEAVTLSYSLSGRVAAAAWAGSFALGSSGGMQQVSIRPGRVSGEQLTLTVSGSNTLRCLLGPVEVLASAGSERR